MTIAIISYSTLACLGNAIDMSLNYHMLDTIRDRGYLESFDLFFHNCEAFSARQSSRLIFDSIICLIFPALISAFFYFQIAIALCKRKKDSSRNATLVTSFILSWLIWIICWTPNYILMHLSSFAQNFTQFRTLNQDSIMTQFNIYSTILRVSLQMFYSHFNPLLFIVVLRPFKKFLSKSVKNAFLKASSADATSEPSRIFSHKMLEKSAQTLQKSGRLMFALTVAGVLGLMLSETGLYSQLGQNRGQEKVNNAANLLTRSTHLRNGRKYFDLFLPSSDPNLLCGINHGTFEMTYRRCFFILHHSGNGLNLTEQNYECQTKMSVLAYPRSMEELEFMWLVYQKYRQWTWFVDYTKADNWYLHLGFRPSVKSPTGRAWKFERLGSMITKKFFPVSIKKR